MLACVLVLVDGGLCLVCVHWFWWMADYAGLYSLVLVDGRTILVCVNCFS